MSQFLGRHLNRLDSKGRVSVPAPFRTSLRATSDGAVLSLVLRSSHKHPCIEAWPPQLFETLVGSLDRFELFSEEHDDMSAALYADAFVVETDREGRVVLPEILVAHAGLTDAVMFMGLGRTFQIWEPEAAERRRAEARERARERGLTLPGSAAPRGSA